MPQHNVEPAHEAAQEGLNIGQTIVEHVSNSSIDHPLIHLPTIAGIFADLKSPHCDMLLSSGRLEKLLYEVQRLHDVARSIEAKSVMLFFHGLHAFLTILANKSIEIPSHRVNAVESRLNSVMATAQQWAEMGKLERAAMQQVVGQ